MLKNIIIAIDGEASSGKSTQAKKIANFSALLSAPPIPAEHNAIQIFFIKMILLI